jgi:hypothetical protein
MIKLKLESQNGAVLDGSPFSIESSHVPRIGEIIALDAIPEIARFGVSEFFVTDVTYVFEGGGLVPYVTGEGWYKGNRLMQLQQLGWLPPSPVGELPPPG